MAIVKNIQPHMRKTAKNLRNIADEIEKGTYDTVVLAVFSSKTKDYIVDWASDHSMTMVLGLLEFLRFHMNDWYQGFLAEQEDDG